MYIQKPLKIVEYLSMKVSHSYQQEKYLELVLCLTILIYRCVIVLGVKQ